MTLAQAAASDGSLTAIQVWTVLIAAVGALAAAYAVTMIRSIKRSGSDPIRELSRIEGNRQHESSRRDAASMWNHDNVTERYQDLLTSVMDYQSAWVEHVDSALSTYPIGDMARAWDAMNASYTKMLHSTVHTLVVARNRVAPLAQQLLAVDSAVLVPFSRRHGAPPIAMRRAYIERGYLSAISETLIAAMRADLGLLDPIHEAMLVMKMRGLGLIEGSAATPDRSCAADKSTDELIELMREYEVGRLAGADLDYRLSTTDLEFYQDQYVGVGGNLNALLVQDNHELFFGTIDKLSDSDRHQALNQGLRSVESGLRRGPGAREMPDGSWAIAFHAEYLDAV